MIQLVVANLYTKYETPIFCGCGDIFYKKVLQKDARTDNSSYMVEEISLTKMWRKRKRNKYREEQYKAMIQLVVVNLFCSPNMNHLSFMVVEISFTKKCCRIMEGWKDGQTDGMTDWL